VRPTPAAVLPLFVLVLLAIELLAPAGLLEYRRALQEDPDRVDFQIALERAMLNASSQHLDQARVFEVRGQLEDALREYRRASDLMPDDIQVQLEFGNIQLLGGDFDEDVDI